MFFSPFLQRVQGNNHAPLCNDPVRWVRLRYSDWPHTGKASKVFFGCLLRTQGPGLFSRYCNVLPQEHFDKKAGCLPVLSSVKVWFQAHPFSRSGIVGMLGSTPKTCTVIYLEHPEFSHWDGDPLCWPVQKPQEATFASEPDIPFKTRSNFLRLLQVILRPKVANRVCCWPTVIQESL